MTNRPLKNTFLLQSLIYLLLFAFVCLNCVQQTPTQKQTSELILQIAVLNEIKAGFFFATMKHEISFFSLFLCYIAVNSESSGAKYLPNAAFLPPLPLKGLLNCESVLIGT